MRLRARVAYDGRMAILSKPQRVRLQSLNVGAGPDGPKIEDIEAMFAAGATWVIGQEFGDRLDMVQRLLKRNPNLRVLWETESNNTRKTPILYDADQVTLTWWSQVITWLGRFLGPKGAGPTVGETKRLNRARFKLKNGVRVKVLNMHATVSAFSTRGEERERRFAAWAQQIEAFFAEVKRTVAVCIGGGDLNVAFGHPELSKRDPANWVWDSPAAGPTMGRRIIDLLGHKRDRRVRVVGQGVVETHGSRTRNDHRSPYVDLEIKPRLRRRR